MLMDFIAKNRTMFMALGAVLLLALGYFFFFNSASTPDLSTGTAASPTELFFANLQSELTPISFDTGLFSDTRFNALVDIRTAITDEAKGRQDPFAPLPGAAKK